MSKKTKAKNQNRFGMKSGRIAVIAVLLALATGVFAWYQLEHYEDNLMEVYARQQDDYVKLVLDQINLIDDRSDESIVQSILSSIDGSNAQYWTLAHDDVLVFVKDVVDTFRYRGLTNESYYHTGSAQEFVQSMKKNEVIHQIIQIDERSFIASGVIFEYGGNLYHLCLLTSEHVVIDHNAYMLAHTSLSIAIAVVLILFLSGVILMGFRGDRLMQKAQEYEAQNQKLREQVAELSGYLVKSDVYDVSLMAFRMQEAPRFYKSLQSHQKVWPVTAALLKLPQGGNAEPVLRAMQVYEKSTVRFFEEDSLLVFFLKCEKNAAKKALALLPVTGLRILALCQLDNFCETNEKLPEQMKQLLFESSAEGGLIDEPGDQTNP